MDGKKKECGGKSKDDRDQTGSPSDVIAAICSADHHITYVAMHLDFSTKGANQ